jgi:hypothetical protein
MRIASPAPTARVCVVCKMCCYLMQGGHIASVEALPGLSDEEAIQKSHEIFLQAKDRFDGFELWDRARVVVRWPDPVPPISTLEPP